LIFHRPTNFLNLKANTKEIIERQRSNVNNKKFIRRGSFENAETIKAAPNHPADKFINQSEKTVNQIGSIFPILKKFII